MLLGLSLATFTLVHVVISLIAIASGFVVLFRMTGRGPIEGWNGLFLVSAILTSVTGFMFPIQGFTPALGLGVLSLIVLAIALYALYGRRLAGTWRPLYAIAAAVALYLNVFVLVAQSFAKLPSLKALAPTQSEPPFVIAQGAVLVLLVLGGFVAQRRFARA